VIGHGGTDQAVGVNVLLFPALVTLLLEQAAGLDKVVFPTILAGALEFVEGGRRGVSLCSRAPAIIGALRGDKGDPRLRGIW